MNSSFMCVVNSLFPQLLIQRWLICSWWISHVILSFLLFNLFVIRSVKFLEKRKKICFTKCSIHINRHTSIHIIWWSQTEIKYFCLPLTKYSFLYLRKIIIKFMLNNKISCRATWWVKWKAMKSIRIEFPWKNVWD